MKTSSTLSFIGAATIATSMASVLPPQEPTLLLNDTYAIQSRELHSRAAGWSFQPSFYGFEARILGLSLVSRKPENLELYVSTDVRHGTAHMYWEEGAKSWLAEYWYKALDGPGGYDHPTGTIVGISRQYTNMEAFFVSDGKYIRSRYWVSGNGWKKSGETKSSLLYNSAAIAATSMRPDTMELFWVASSGGSVYHSYWIDGKGWVKDQVLFGPSNGWAKGNSITAFSRDYNHQDVVWITTSGAIQVASYDNGWTKREIIGPKAHANSRIASISPNAGEWSVFYVGTDSKVYALRWNAKNPSQFVGEKVSDIQADTRTFLSVVSRSSNLLEVFWLATDGTIKHAYWDSANKWRSEPLPGSNSGTACLPGADLTVLSRKGKNTIEGFCVAKANPSRLHHFYYYG